MISLEAGDWRATTAPERGGAILSLDWRGAPIFRPTPQGSTDMLLTACFPLVPYANRIADARFAFEGRRIELHTLDRFAPHALHGDGWLNPWTLEATQAHCAEMTLIWPGDTPGWPWPWCARQIITLSDAGLEIILSVTNTGEAAMPAGLGLHPDFHKGPNTRLTLSAAGVWLTDARDIPVGLASPDAVVDWTHGVALAQAPFVDHAYAGWNGEALIDGDCRRLVLSCTGANCAQVYAPLGADFFCVEPVTHRPDALNAQGDQDGGMTRLKPGESLSIAMRLSLSESPD